MNSLGDNKQTTPVHKHVARNFLWELNTETVQPTDNLASIPNSRKKMNWEKAILASLAVIFALSFLQCADSFETTLYTGATPKALAVPKALNLLLQGLEEDLISSGKLVLSAIRMELTEKDTGYEVTVEVPGIPKNNIDVSVGKNSLSVSVNNEIKSDGDRGQVHWSERQYGRITRTIRLPENINSDQIQAKYEKGMLILTIPKEPKQKEEPKRIEIS